VLFKSDISPRVHNIATYVDTDLQFYCKVMVKIFFLTHTTGSFNFVSFSMSSVYSENMSGKWENNY